VMSVASPASSLGISRRTDFGRFDEAAGRRAADEEDAAVPVTGTADAWREDGVSTSGATPAALVLIQRHRMHATPSIEALTVRLRHDQSAGAAVLGVAVVLPAHVASLANCGIDRLVECRVVCRAMDRHMQSWKWQQLELEEARVVSRRSQAYEIDAREEWCGHNCCVAAASDTVTFAVHPRCGGEAGPCAKTGERRARRDEVRSDRSEARRTRE
jgi:hypothetical protein